MISLPYVFFLIGLAAAFALTHVIVRDQRAASRDTLWAAVIGGAVVARLVYIGTHLPHYREHPFDGLRVWDGGFVIWAGLIAALAIAVGLAQRRSIAPVRIAIPLAVGAMIWALLKLSQHIGPENAPKLADAVFTDMNGASVQLAHYRGQPVVINLWATWCPPCRREMPVLAAAQVQHPGVHIVLANQKEARQVVADYLQREKLKLKNVLLDTSAHVSAEYRAAGLPTTLFFDADGTLRHRHTGELSTPRLDDYIQSISRPE
jgi:thiol-disulfide isomerase/thioredoxin